MKSLFATIQEPSVVKALGLTGAATFLNFVSVTLGICATAVAIAYTVWRWRRDAKLNTCDVASCPRRHIPPG